MKASGSRLNFYLTVSLLVLAGLALAYVLYQWSCGVSTRQGVYGASGSPPRASATDGFTPAAPRREGAVVPGSSGGPVPGRPPGAPGPPAAGGPSAAPGVPGTGGEAGGREDPSDPDLAELFHQANRLAATGVYDRALKLFQRILEKNPDHPFTLVNAARIHFIQGRTEEAIRLLERADRVLPGQHRTLAYLGIAEGRAGRYERAVQLLERSSALDPSRLDVLNHLAAAKAHLGRTEEAAAVWRQILERDPDNAEARAGLHRLQEGTPSPAGPPAGPARPPGPA
jgi:tetratricopeptide (TPR) repeat protein